MRTQREKSLKELFQQDFFRFKNIAVKSVHFIDFNLLKKLLLENDFYSFKPSIPLSFSLFLLRFSVSSVVTILGSQKSILDKNNKIRINNYI